MKRTFLVLALAVLASAGCRAIGPGGAGCSAPVGPGCGDACGDAYCEPYGDACCDSCGDQCCNGRGGNLANSGICLGGGNGAFFGRYCGQDCSAGGGGCCPLGCDCRSTGGCCGDGYHPGPYDCSPCDSPAWGCSGYRHPHGYVTGNECYCYDPSRPAGPQFAHLHGQGYCGVCGQPSPSCVCNSGDQYYNFNPGPPVAQTAYPYYTLRGPRDYLLNNPPSIGPY